ncbi:ethanolamine utilization cob(I)yrinic acid a,c-diamide adenosyltransferase EutT [Sedimenticola thiotaurini]|uniref:Cobalamin adenosyltransferase n=1 Tax=Sedimenticola thiotaurini TaxID=1543721 RepID=A0A0F7JSR8_9GAMM|nr:ethanolamine utilization cob(I)yrinic acid a,c-diamide adenosyltransferase EutT [Sedimenticola thiotaurini]AKH19496.1 cobalamin adenosyltransferase [Sedimenticola thiotaurini]
MPKFITESWLRDKFGLTHGSEIHLPAGSNLTPSAAQLLAERKIRIRYLDEAGRVYLDKNKQDRGEQLVQVHPLTGGNHRPANSCAVCNSHVDKKGELLTLLDCDRLVPKTHPRISLRGKLDTLIAQTIDVQTRFDPEHKYPLLHKLLADLRSYMGDVLRSEVTGEQLQPLQMGSLDEEALHQVSHQPLKFLGHDHLLPDASYGANAAMLNLLRALSREVELEACRVYVTDEFTLSREDIVQGLNRLSSALYVLSIMTVVSESGAVDKVEKVVAV